MKYVRKRYICEDCGYTVLHIADLDYGERGYQCPDCGSDWIGVWICDHDLNEPPEDEPEPEEEPAFIPGLEPFGEAMRSFRAMNIYSKGDKNVCISEEKQSDRKEK